MSKPKSLSSKSFEQSTMKFSEAEALYNAGDLENRDLSTLVEMKGVYNKVKTGIGDKERKIDDVIKEKAKVAPIGEVKQLDFDSITMSTEIVEDVEYSLDIPLKKFMSEAAGLGVDGRYIRSKEDKKLIFKDYEDGLMHPDLRPYIKSVKSKQFRVERVKKDAKS